MVDMQKDLNLNKNSCPNDVISSDYDKTKIAVFDFDGTCIDVQSGALFSRYLLTHGYLKPKTVIKLLRWAFRYLFHMKRSEDEPREALFADLNHMTGDEVDQLMVKFHDEIISSEYRKDAMDEIKQLQDQGYVVLLVSATFAPIARRAAEVLGIQTVLATEMQKDSEGHYTGKVEGLAVVGQEKTRAVERWANEHIGEGKWVIAKAFGDHYSDAYILDASSEGYAVSPGGTLKRIAKKNDWTILDW